MSIVRPGSSSPTTPEGEGIVVVVPAGTNPVSASVAVTAGGVSATASDTYHHNQTSASALWTINHNLGIYPNVTVIGSDGSVVEGDIQFTSRNQVRLTFSQPITGNAYLS